jgi:hypothetical protein
MNRFWLRQLPLGFVVVAFLAALTIGCSGKKEEKKDERKEPPVRDKDKDDPFRELGKPVDEDPEVADFVKSKGWSLHRDIRISDHKPLVYLTVENKDKPFEDVAITADDLKKIAKSKSMQVLDLRHVKNMTDDWVKLLAGIPQLESVILNGDAITDAGMKSLAQATSLEDVVLFTKSVTDEGVKELAKLPKLRSLFFLGLKLTGSCFEAFAGSKTLKSVTLEMVDGFTDEGAKHLAKLPNLDELKVEGGFRESKLTAAGIKAIVDARLPAKFKFDKKLIDDALLESLVAKGWLYGPTPPGATEKKPATPEEVGSISLEDSKVTDRGMQAVLNCTNVKSVFLGKTAITDETLKKMAAFPRLDYLSLGRTKITAAGLEAVAGRPIKHVAMEGCDLTEDHFKAFGKMTGLEKLILANAKMKAEWLKHIAKLPKLKELYLLQADFDDAAAKVVSAMPELESLTLNGTNLGDAGFQELLKMPSLKSLYVDGTKVTKEVYQKAKKDHPKLTLYFYSYDR